MFSKCFTGAVDCFTLHRIEHCQVASVQIGMICTMRFTITFIGIDSYFFIKTHLT